jgi:hypothetical protein
MQGVHAFRILVGETMIEIDQLLPRAASAVVGSFYGAGIQPRVDGSLDWRPLASPDSDKPTRFR